jgi:very-long-chain enoyl-CoA reductase
MQKSRSVPLRAYNVACACAWTYVFVTATSNATDLAVLTVVQTAQLVDVAFAVAGATPTQPGVAAVQVASRIVVLYGTDLGDLRHALAGTWALADLARFWRVVAPDVPALATMRYALFWALYPLGMVLECACIARTYATWVASVAILAYALVGPRMYDHMARQSARHALRTAYGGAPTDGRTAVRFGRDTLHVETRADIDRHLSPARQRWTTDADGVAVLKDLGLQVGWRVVFVLEYFGPLVVYTAWRDTHDVDVVLWSLHYAKRLLETLVVHKFSRATMPLTNLFRNCAYYWGAAALISRTTHPGSDVLWPIVGAWAVAQVANGACHVHLAHIRTGVEYARPTFRPFRWVVCPNYSFEVLGWALFALQARSPMAGAFAALGAAQMYDWGRKKRARYLELFGDAPRGVLVPLSRRRRGDAPEARHD